MRQKGKFSVALNNFWQALRTSVAEHPAEMLMLLYLGVFSCFSDIWGIQDTWYAQPCSMAFLMVVLSYSLQPLRRRPLVWRLLYWLPVVLCAAVWWMPFLGEWCKSESFMFLAIACVPLWLLMRNRVFENEPFARCAARMGTSVLYAIVLVGAVQLLFMLIMESVQLLFVSDNDYQRYEQMWKWFGRIASFLFIGVAPMLFIVFEERKQEFTFGKLLHALLNWVLTPALLIYTVILYVYAVKILVTASLPRGWVSDMVLAYCLVALVAQMAQHLCSKRPFRWFYDHFSLFALPLQVLFWVAVVRRLTDYGFTPSRYMLLLFGLLMTLYVVLFLFRNRRGYFIVAAVALAFSLLPVVVPALGPKAVSRYSQVHRVRVAASQLGILSPDGKLLLPVVADSSSLDTSDYADRRLHRVVYQSLRYLYDDSDSLLLERTFGLKHCSDYLVSLSDATAAYATSYRVEEDNESDEARLAVEKVEYCYLWCDSKQEFDISGYNSFWRGDPSLTATGIVFPFGELPQDDLMRSWFEDRGVPRTVSRDWIQDHQAKLMLFQNDTMKVIFNRLELYRDTATRCWHIDTVGVVSDVMVFRTARLK